MRTKLLSLIILPAIIISVVIFSLKINPQTQTNPNHSINKNPTPQDIRVLGTERTKQNQKFSFETEKLYRLISEYRKENGLNKLFINKSLEDSAHRKLQDMIEKEYFKHSDNNNNQSWYLFKASGYNYIYAGENLSSGYNTPWQVFDAWRQSPKHNQQLLKKEYLDMGLAVNCEKYKLNNKPACIVVLHLGSR